MPSFRTMDSSDCAWTHGCKDTHQAPAKGPFPLPNLGSHFVQPFTLVQSVLGDSLIGPSAQTPPLRVY